MAVYQQVLGRRAQRHQSEVWGKGGDLFKISILVFAVAVAVMHRGGGIPVSQLFGQGRDHFFLGPQQEHGFALLPSHFQQLFRQVYPGNPFLGRQAENPHSLYHANAVRNNLRLLRKQQLPHLRVLLGVHEYLGVGGYNKQPFPFQHGFARPLGILLCRAPKDPFQIVADPHPIASLLPGVFHRAGSVPHAGI